MKQKTRAPPGESKKESEKNKEVRWDIHRKHGDRESEIKHYAAKWMDGEKME